MADAAASLNCFEFILERNYNEYFCEETKKPTCLVELTKVNDWRVLKTERQKLQNEWQDFYNEAKLRNNELLS